MSSSIAAAGARRHDASAMMHARCRNCASFIADPLALESAIPGLRSFGSGFAAVRDGDGLCAKHGRYLAASAACPQFSPAA